MTDNLAAAMAYIRMAKQEAFRTLDPDGDICSGLLLAYEALKKAIDESEPDHHLGCDCDECKFE